MNKQLKDENIVSGDIIFLWNMPRYLMNFLDFVTYSPPCHHVALVLEIGNELSVIEAYPPRVRYLPLEDYKLELQKWSKNCWHPAKMRAEIAHCSDFTKEDIENIKSKALSYLGTPYRLFLKRGQGVNCSEFAARALLGSSLFNESDFPDPIYQTRPIDIRYLLQDMNTEFYKYEYQCA